MFGLLWVMGGALSPLCTFYWYSESDDRTLDQLFTWLPVVYCILHILSTLVPTMYHQFMCCCNSKISNEWILLYNRIMTFEKGPAFGWFCDIDGYILLGISQKKQCVV
eukprot:UN05649